MINMKEKIKELIQDPTNIDIAHALCVGQDISFSSILFECNDKKIIGEAAQLIAVKQDAWNIRYCVNPTEKVKIEAVKQEPYAVQFLSNPSEAVQLEAVKEDPYAVQFLSNPSEAVQLEALKLEPDTLQFCIWTS